MKTISNGKEIIGSVRGRVRRMALALPALEKQGSAYAQPELPLPDYLKIFARKGNDFTRAPPNVNLRHFVLIVSLRGTADVLLDDVAVTLSPGGAVLLFPDQYHRYRRTKGDLLWLFFSFIIESGQLLLPLRYAVVNLSVEMWRHLKNCLQAYDCAGRASPYAGGSLLVEFWLLLLGLLECKRVSARNANIEPAVFGRKYRLILEAQQYILEHIAQPVAVADVARRIGLSVTATQLLFRQHLHRSVGEAIRRMRVGNAANLITNTDAPFKQIAAKCGFSSVYVFSRAFKKVSFYSPAVYRHMQQSIEKGATSRAR